MEHELKRTRLLGGPGHGKHVRDDGSLIVHFNGEHVYKRTELILKSEKEDAEIAKEVFLYFGKRWDV